MIKIIVDETTKAKLQNLEERLELCDETGRTLGYFSPVAEKSLYEGLEIPLSEEELDRREKGTVWYTTG